MIDELVLEQLLDELGQEIAVPPDGAERVVLELATVGRTTRRPSPRASRLLMVAAASPASRRAWSADALSEATLLRTADSRTDRNASSPAQSVPEHATA